MARDDAGTELNAQRMPAGCLGRVHARPVRDGLVPAE